MAAESTYVKANTHGSITLSDATGTPVTKTLAYDKGDLSISGLRSKLNAVNHVQRRGRYVSSHHGERTFPAVSLSCFLPNVVGSTSSAPGSVLEFLTMLGAYAGNTNPLGTGRPAACKLALTIEGTNFGDTADESVTLNSLVITELAIAEAADGNTITISGEVVGTVVITNNTNTVTLSEIS